MGLPFNNNSSAQGRSQYPGSTNMAANRLSGASRASNTDSSVPRRSPHPSGTNISANRHLSASGASNTKSSVLNDASPPNNNSRQTSRLNSPAQARYLGPRDCNGQSTEIPLSSNGLNALKNLDEMIKVEKNRSSRQERNTESFVSANTSKRSTINVDHYSPGHKRRRMSQSLSSSDGNTSPQHRDRQITNPRNAGVNDSSKSSSAHGNQRSTFANQKKPPVHASRPQLRGVDQTTTPTRSKQSRQQTTNNIAPTYTSETRRAPASIPLTRNVRHNVVMDGLKALAQNDSSHPQAAPTRPAQASNGHPVTISQPDQAMTALLHEQESHKQTRDELNHVKKELAELQEEHVRKQAESDLKYENMLL